MPITDTIDLAAPMLSPPATTLRLGYVPLTDAAPLLVASHKGWFARHGLRVELTRLAAWSSIRDRVMFGAIDGAQMLAPMPLAPDLGEASDLRVVATLGRNGNTVTLGEALLAEIAAAAPARAPEFPLPATALAAALAARRTAGRPPPTIAVVYPFSSHNYLLRYWLATGGIDADRDVRLVVVPPPLVADALAEGEIDGFCAGEPWGSRAVDLRAGRIVLTSADIWRNHPEKVLAFPATVLARDPGAVVACIAALIEAARWLDMPEHQPEAAALLCAHAFDTVPPELVLPGLRGMMQLAPDAAPTAVAPLSFHRHAATFPFRSQGAWWQGQMRRWGHAASGGVEDIWCSTFWRRAAGQLGEAQPLRDGKTEGGHDDTWQLPATAGTLDMPADRFIDGARFTDPVP
jgi:ABC-type nitrate/sulfonate/bicarbonate transport system substrate-binding protein